MRAAASLGCAAKTTFARCVCLCYASMRYIAASATTRPVQQVDDGAGGTGVAPDRTALFRGAPVTVCIPCIFGVDRHHLFILKILSSAPQLSTSQHCASFLESITVPIDTRQGSTCSPLTCDGSAVRKARRSDRQSPNWQLASIGSWSCKMGITAK